MVAHEVGHHVQDLLGILDKVDAAKHRVSQIQANALSVRVELQADCLAGVWAANANQKYGPPRSIWQRRTRGSGLSILWSGKRNFAG